jgi:2-polyprenyl-6-methoxyphenol hydroxylase-like FAD-dependent oxidoreductase
MPVLIVGAGPAGLTAAIELARRGVPYRIVDAAAEHSPGSRGKGLQPRTLEVFADLGVLDRVLATGGPYPPMRVRSGGAVVHEGRIAPERAATPDVPYPNGWMLPQNLTDGILRDRLAELGGRVELGTELVDLAADGAGVTATLRHDGAVEEVRVEYLVGADGGRSAVRRRLGIPLLGETREDQRALVADVPVPGLDRDHWHIWGTEGASAVALCPLAGTELFVLQAAMLGDEPVAATAETVRRVFAERSGTGIELGEPRWITVWRANMRMAERFREGRVFLVGDAAHVHSPAGGQGLNTSIQDAYNLGWKLAAVQGGAPAGLLDTYEDERLPVAAGVLNISRKLHDRGFDDEGDPIDRSDPELAQLHVSYRRSALSVDDRTAPGRVRAGDRAPDAPYRDGTLFGLYAGPHPTVLAFGPAALPDIPGVPGLLVDDATDGAGHVRRLYDMEPGMVVVVRPDGHIGLVTGDPSRVPGYLGTMNPVGLAVR